MKNNVNIGCMIYACGLDRYGTISKTACSSFKAFHPNINLHHITNENLDTLENSKEFDKKYKGRHELFRWAVALELMIKHKYDKIIMLGADTITCAPLTEFIDNNIEDAILTLDEPYQLSIGLVARDVETKEPLSGHPVGGLHTPVVVTLTNEKRRVFFDHINSIRKTLDEEGLEYTTAEYTHCNTDVVCFNNSKCLQDLHDFYFRYMEDHKHMETLGLECGECYNEQGALNVLLILGMASLFGLVDKDREKAALYGYESLMNYRVALPELYGREGSEPVLYNVRSKKSWDQRWLQAMVRDQYDDPDFEICNCDSIKKFKIVDQKLYTERDIQIKVWHYGAGLLEASKDDFTVMESVNSYIYYKFNRETKKFFKEACHTGEFFEKPFII